MVIRAVVVFYDNRRGEGKLYANTCIIQILIFNDNIRAIYEYDLTCPIGNSSSFYVLPVVNRFSIHGVAFIYFIRVIVQCPIMNDNSILKHDIAC